MAAVSSNQPATNIGAQSALGEIINDDKERKSRLSEISTQIKKILEKDESLRDVMTTEFGNKILDIHHKREEADNECPIVVAGEISAGKSSLINLLVGRSILPERQLTCTTTICRLRNSEDRRIVLTDYDDNKTEILFSKEEEVQMEDTLEKHVGRKSNPDRCKYVDIYLPIPMLQNHATIVDTPGVGKNKTGRLFEYLPNAIAFIYVINAGNAGGVTNDDWLLQIIEHLTEQQKNGHMHDFRPETTMFVCNKWDQVHPKEQDEVFQFIVNKLKSDWPNFDESLQIFKLSAVKEKKRIKKNGSQSDNYDYFVSGIRRMIPATLEAKVDRHARWQMFFIEKITDRIKEKLSASKMSLTEKEKKMKEAEDRLQHLDEKHLKEIKEKANRNITFKCEEISHKIVNHLKSLTTEHFTWECDTLPDDEKDIVVIREKAKEHILQKIKHEINDWRLKNKDLVDKELKQVLVEEFKIMEEDLKLITPFVRMLTKYESSNYFLTILSFVSRYPGIGNIIPFVASPSVLLGYPGIASSLGYGLASWALYRFWYNKGSLEKYKANKIKYMKEWTEDVIRNRINHKEVSELMKPFLNHQLGFINDICKFVVPQVLQAEKKFIEDIMNDCRSVFDISKKIVPLLCDCQILLGKLDLIFLEYFKKSEVALLYVHNIEMTSPIANGESSDVYKAKCQLDKRELQGAVKTFKMPLKESENFLQLSEIYSLRKLQRHPNIMQLIGLAFRKDHEQRFLQIFMELCEDSLHNIVYKKRSPIPCGSIQNLTDCKDSWKFVTEIIKGICDGLDHIHNKGFVHRDLRIENIMIKASTQVKLVKIGFSKKGIEDPSAEITRREVNMAPEVFLGDLTGSEADVYSVGMIIYELWYYRPGFSKPLPNKPTEYEFIINTVDELKTLVLQKYDQNKGRPDLKEGKSPPRQLKNILKKCWDTDKDKRPTPSNLFKLLSGVPITMDNKQ